jgi:hypothetical protein
MRKAKAGRRQTQQLLRRQVGHRRTEKPCECSLGHSLDGNKKLDLESGNAIRQPTVGLMFLSVGHALNSTPRKKQGAQPATTGPVPAALRGDTAEREGLLPWHWIRDCCSQPLPSPPMRRLWISAAVLAATTVACWRARRSPAGWLAYTLCTLGLVPFRKLAGGPEDALLQAVLSVLRYGLLHLRLSAITRGLCLLVPAARLLARVCYR